MKLLLVPVAVYLAYAGMFFLAQRRIIYPAAGIAVPDPDPVPAGVERIWLEPSFGRVEAWFLEASVGGQSSALIFAHGNGEVIDHWPELMRDFTARGVSVLLVEYPGYGRSGGSPTQETLTRTFERAHDWLARHPAVDSERIYGMGRSLGGGVVATLSRTRPLAGLVLLSTFSSVGSLAWQAYRLPGFLALDPYDTAGALKNFRGRVLVFHGTQDDQIPFSHGEALAAAAQQARLIAWPCGHNDCPPEWATFVEQVAVFLDESAADA